MLKIFVIISALICFSDQNIHNCIDIQKSYESSKINFDLLKQHERYLIDNKLVFEIGMPGYYFWNKPELTPEQTKLVNTSTVLLLTALHYNELYMTSCDGDQLSLFEKIKQLQALTECLSLEHQCKISTKYCDQFAKYRSIDGSCNDPNDPYKGAANTQFSRMLRAQYEDGIHSIRLSKLDKSPLPLARVLGNKMFSPPNKTANLPRPLINQGASIFGQFIAHDMSLAADNQNVIGANILNCCSKDNRHILPNQFTNQWCMPMSIPLNDAFFSKYNSTCMEFTRTAPIMSSDCKLSHAEKLSLATPVLDLSTLYGNDKNTLSTVRLYIDGKLKTGSNNVFSKKECDNMNGPCYVMADDRNTMFPTTAIITTLFLRLHNSIVEKLAYLFPMWNDQKLFDEGRRTTIAIYQNIVYEMWAPIFMNKENALESGVICGKELFCGKYHPKINPNTLTEFAVGAFRLFHIWIPDKLELYKNHFTRYKSVKFSDTIHNTKFIESDYMGIVRGMLYQVPLFSGVSNEIRNYAFNRGNKHFMGIDITAMDAQRGRDHGLAPYTAYIELCLPDFGPIRDWDDLKSLISQEKLDVLKTIYKSVFDLDLIIGIFFETKKVYLGPIAMCIFKEQLYRTKHGDNFFYALENNRYPFTEDQMKAIRGYTFADLLCELTDLDNVPRNAFLWTNNVNEIDDIVVNCDSTKKLDLSSWLK